MAWIDIPIPTLAHEDYMRAKTGDASARYRTMMRARSDPGAHAQVKVELEDALRERWLTIDPESAEEERHALELLNNDELVSLDT